MNEDEKIAKEMREKNQFWEDDSILFKEDVERDLIDMVKSGMPKRMFQDSAKNLIGEDWEVDGLNIIRAEDPSLINKFNEYCDVDEEPAKKD